MKFKAEYTLVKSEFTPMMQDQIKSKLESLLLREVKKVSSDINESKMAEFIANNAKFKAYDIDYPNAENEYDLIIYNRCV